MMRVGSVHLEDLLRDIEHLADQAGSLKITETVTDMQFENNALELP